ncbi:WD domain, G-beta repeat-containing protein [Besnoitia besnoiti]|uniref:WD domain, G-beta repeat-containing protein n=1 Tax=Besnoitia besnoiti TaxID=94643 RepID=A0A2A9M6U5_BESBE|nr:WD domain, G-beta repeat-containing protein [Besnoitia besnoiti]PFH31347.1 WD domain, G-beta repeat-containing protein [Besnoitia besnoiti]
MPLFDDDVEPLDDSAASSSSSCPECRVSPEFSSVNFCSASLDPRLPPSSTSCQHKNGSLPSSLLSAACLSPRASSSPSSSPTDSGGPTPAVNGCAYSLEERHMIWRKNAALHYGAVLSHKMEWPSMTVEFLTPPSSSSFAGGVSGRGSAASAVSTGDAYVSHRLLLGTCTNGEEKNFLTIAELRWPAPSLEEDPLKCESYSGFIPPRARAKSILASAGLPGGPGNATAAAASASLAAQHVPSLETKARILHPGDLIRAKHMPQNAFNIVTINEEGLGMYWNFSRHPSFPAADQVIAKPQLLLSPPGSSSELAKLQAAAWMPGGENAGFLFSCTDTGLVCLWDLRKTGAQHMPKSRDSLSTSGLAHVRKTVYGGNVTIAEGTPEISPLACVSLSSSASSSSLSLNDIQVHPRYPVVVGTAGEDGALRVFDMRQAHGEALSVSAASAVKSSVSASSLASDSSLLQLSSSSAGVPLPAKQRVYPPVSSPGVSAAAAPAALNSLSFNRHSEHVVAVGSARGAVSLFDLRLLARPFLSLFHDSEEVTALQFAPSASSLLAAASAGGDVVLWDLSERAAGAAVSAARLRREKNEDVEMGEGEASAAAAAGAASRQAAFVHAGHAAGVSDFAWCAEAASAGAGGGAQGGRRSEPAEKGRVGALLGASVAWDNRVQVWQPSEHLFVDQGAGW